GTQQGRRPLAVQGIEVIAEIEIQTGGLLEGLVDVGAGEELDVEAGHAIQGARILRIARPAASYLADLVRRAAAQLDARVGDEAVGAVEQQNRLRILLRDQVLEVHAPVVQLGREIFRDVPGDAGGPVLGGLRTQRAVTHQQTARVDGVATDRLRG